MTVHCALKLPNLVPTPPHLSLMSRPNTEFEILSPQHLFAWELHWPSWPPWLFVSEMWSLYQLLQLTVALLISIMLSLDSLKSWLFKQASEGLAMVSTHCIHTFKSIFIYIHSQLVHSICFVVLALIATNPLMHYEIMFVDLPFPWWITVYSDLSLKKKKTKPTKNPKNAPNPNTTKNPKSLKNQGDAKYLEVRTHFIWNKIPWVAVLA